MIFGFGRPKTPPVIRSGEMSDARDIAELHAQSFDIPWGLMEFERLLSEQNILSHVAVAEEAGARVQGFVLSRLVGDEAEILSIAVDPRQRGKGLAGRLLAVHRESLVLSQVGVLFLEVEDGNSSAIALYKRYDFTQVSRREAYYRKADGSAATALVMRRML